MSRHKLDMEKLAEIVEKYNVGHLVVSEAYDDRGTDHLWGRLEGGAINQMEGGDAMAARYAIWVNTVRDLVIKGMRAMESGDDGAASSQLIQAANSMSAFADIQAWLDPFDFGKKL